MKTGGKDTRYIKIFLLAAAILFLVKLVFDFNSFTGVFNAVMAIIRPFVFGFIVAYCINIPVSWFEEIIKKFADLEKVNSKILKKVARPISIVVNLAALGGFITFGLMNFVPMLYENISSLVAEMPAYINSGIEAAYKLPYADELGIKEILDNLSMDDVLTFVPEMEVSQMVSGLFSGVFAAFMTLVATLYFLAEYNRVKDFIKRLIRAHSPKRQRPIVKYIRLVDFSFRKFLTCQFLDSLVLSTITMIAFTFMGSKYAVTLALMLGVLNVIPYFGSIFGSAMAVFIIWAESGEFKTAVIVAITLMIIQQIDGNFINPRIMGASFKISPVLVIIAITIGGAIGGILGMIFAIPIANVLKTVLEEYIKNKEELRVSLGESPEQIAQEAANKAANEVIEESAT